ncbi:MAG: CapA family protein [Clostridia bacterium]|nr:CapA family protein [Clostridia bacterium]
MRLILCGDIVPTLYTVPAFDAADAKTLMGGALEVLARGDFAVANLECALTDSEERIRKCGPNLKGKPEYARVLADCGFTHLGLSNNHVMDFGIAGARDTEKAIAEAGMASFGIGEDDQDSRRPIFLEKDGVRAAIVAVCEHEYSYALRDRYGSNPFDPFDTMEDIALAKEQADYVIVMYHGGKEQCEYPSPRLRKACRAMVRAGADIVLCQHSHCVGCREEYRGGEIVYGQGNFNFVKYVDHPHWHNGLMMDVQLEGDLKVEYIPVVAADEGIELAKGAEREAILSGFAERSALLQDEEQWLAAWKAFCESMPNYIAAVRDAYTDVPEGEMCRQIFPHYLDCEAHLDVWQTIYKTWHADKTSGA